MGWLYGEVPLTRVYKLNYWSKGNSKVCFPKKLNVSQFPFLTVICQVTFGFQLAIPIYPLVNKPIWVHARFDKMFFPTEQSLDFLKWPLKCYLFCVKPRVTHYNEIFNLCSCLQLWDTRKRGCAQTFQNIYQVSDLPLVSFWLHQCATTNDAYIYT